MQTRLFFIFLLFLFIAAPANAFITTKPLSADKAFNVSVVMDDANNVNVHWTIAKGYYLYRQKLQFVFEPKIAADIRLPQGEIKQDLNHGQYEIFKDSVNVPIVLHGVTQPVQLTIHYQGCSEKGFCYPPLHQSMMLNVSKNIAFKSEINKSYSTSMQSLLTNQNEVKTLLGSQNIVVMLLLFMGIGLLLAFTPCIFPMIPILTAIIVGHKQPVSTSKAFLLSSTYVFGSSLMYALAGMLAAYMGSSLQASLQQPWILVIVSGLFVLLALSLFGFYDLQLPRRLQNRITSFSRKQQGGTYAGVFVIGAMSTLIVSPCVTAPLVGVLMYIAESGNMTLGGSALFAMGLGMGIPLIVIGVTAQKWLPRRGPWMVGVQRLCGVLMLGMAFWIFPSFQHVSTPSSAFIIVHNVEELNHQLSVAAASGKPVLLDFYADWCESCVIMDKNVFQLPEVMNSLNKFVLLRADLSNNTPADERMLKNFEVIAPPTVLFFNHYGKEVNSRRIVGELNAMEFMTRVNTFITASCDKNITC